MKAQFSLRGGVEFVEVAMGGESKDVVAHPATDKDRQRHAAAYAAFKAGPKDETNAKDEKPKKAPKSKE